MKTIIFVCHGNICRSPAAKYIFDKIVQDLRGNNEFFAISRAVSYEEIGNNIYPPMKETLRRNNIPFSHHYANIISREDYEKADYIFYMDESNKRRLSNIVDDYKHICFPIFKFTPEIREIEDPWYTGRYQLVVEQITKCVNDILHNI